MSRHLSYLWCLKLALVWLPTIVLMQFLAFDLQWGFWRAQAFATPCCLVFNHICARAWVYRA